MSALLAASLALFALATMVVAAHEMWERREFRRFMKQQAEARKGARK